MACEVSGFGSRVAARGQNKKTTQSRVLQALSKLILLAGVTGVAEGKRPNSASPWRGSSPTKTSLENPKMKMKAITRKGGG